jgi:hypothetical protein
MTGAVRQLGKDTQDSNVNDRQIDRQQSPFNNKEVLLANCVLSLDQQQGREDG